MREARPSKSRSLSLVRVPEVRGRGRRAAGVAFMSLGLLVGWTGSTGRPAGSRGMVLSSHPVSKPMWTNRVPSRYMRGFVPTSPLSTYVLLDDRPPPAPTPSVQRVIGRISAWTCTTLYLTSRLPQIWMNVRLPLARSTLGPDTPSSRVDPSKVFPSFFSSSPSAATYSMSSPSCSIRQATQTPARPDTTSSKRSRELMACVMLSNSDHCSYLLGSGGTLVFDLTIVLQSVVYGAAPPIVATPLGRSSRRHHGLSRRILRYPEEEFDVAVSAERQPLLSGSIQLERSLSPDISLRGSQTLRQQGARRPSIEAPDMPAGQGPSG